MTMESLNRILTVKEFFDLELDSEENLEYFLGTVFSISGCTLEHSLIAANLLGHLGTNLRQTQFRVLNSSLQIRIAGKPIYLRPDLMVIAGDPEFDEPVSTRRTILNPTLIAEVMSTSTEARDRGAKFTAYREIESLQEYLLVSTDCAQIEAYFRQANGTWHFTPVVGIDAIIRLRSVGATLNLSEVYAGVTVPPHEQEQAVDS